MVDVNYKYKNLVGFLEKESIFKPDLALVLGSGLGEFAERIELIKSISTGDLPGYPASTVSGHSGKIIWGKYKGKNLLLFQGRIHFYEGYLLSECILPVFISYKLGAHKLILTNAAGGVNSRYRPGNLMLATSFNGINIKKELTDLIGLAGIEKKDNLLNFPSVQLNNLIKEAAFNSEIDLKEGVYWYTKGPSYETPAEIMMISKFGGDAVGMSTVHEAFFAASMGMELSAISCITNYAAGISDKKLDHQEVMITANLVKTKFENLIKGTIELVQRSNT
ncbi:MAG: purine-nucleoside phosphorylase [Ignavibacteriaceae bacterium]